jgi:hypothetical protein
LAVNVSPQAPSAIIGSPSISPNQENVPYSIVAVPDAISYYWTVPSGATIATGQGTNSITVNFGSETGNISVRSQTTCGNSAFIYYTISHYGSLTDFDGNVYNTVVIGSQTWTAENLKTTHFNDGTLIPNISNPTTWSQITTPAYCCTIMIQLQTLMIMEPFTINTLY